MNAKRTKLHDVAAAAGVHPSTVSRALNPRTRHLVSAEVAGRLQRLARRLGYRPDPVASGLRTRRSATVGVLVPDIANPMFPLILRGIEASLARAGFTAIIADTENDPARAREAIERLAARRIDGAIVATAVRRDPLVAHCLGLGLPVVLVNRSVEGGACSAVVNDDAAGIALAVAHLAALGHRSIGHIAAPSRFSTGQHRRAGFVAALKANGLPAVPHAIAVTDRFGIAAGAQACARLLEAAPDVTAIVAANDLIALGCYDALKAAGLACPRDVSVTGFNDMAFADRFDPPLTSVRIPHHLMGMEAARLLLAEIENPAAPKQEIKLQARLVVRGSTARPRRRRQVRLSTAAAR